MLSVTRILPRLSSFHYITNLVPSRKSRHRETLGTHACAPRASQLLKRRQFSVTVLTPATFQPGHRALLRELPPLAQNKLRISKEKPKSGEMCDQCKAKRKNQNCK